jgi:hypothetical protein
MQSQPMPQERAVNEDLELWSLPWHALQRRLADGFHAEAARLATRTGGAATGWMFTGGTGPRAPRAVLDTTSWMARARMTLSPTTRLASGHTG